MNTEKIISLFKGKHFRATPQRVAVYKYVCEHRVHPDALEVYENVKQQHPGFSKTTVYNALKSLVESGFIITVTIDGERVRYDADTSLHGHFYCNNCKKIYDFSVSQPQAVGIDGFITVQKDVYYSGICAGCGNK